MLGLKLEIEKMIKQYDVKIENSDFLVEKYRKVIAVNRKNGFDEENKIYRKDRAIEQARRQAYVQAKYDLDSLFDYI